MPFSRPTFMGASVLRVNNQIQWNTGGSTFDVTLVEDPTNSDAFTYPTIGTPVTFAYGSLSFRGLINKYVKTYDRNGYPVFEVNLSDTKQLLEGAKVILSEYRLSVTGIRNLFNVFGYWENTGYGNSQANGTGMPWGLVTTGIENICNSGFGDWGGPISYQGVTYGIDLSELPALPSYFRVGGQSVSILDYIQLICDAANYDFFLRLTDLNVIQVKTVPRTNAYPLGTIGTMLTTTFDGSVLRSGDGLEQRAETTSTFVVGGEVHTLYKVGQDSFSPFWGFDASGTIIKGASGSGQYARFLAPFGPGNPATSQEVYSYPVNLYNLYIPDIGNITGNTTWQTNDLELQILLGLGQNRDTFGSWVQYLRISNPSLYLTINLSSAAYSNVQPSPALTSSKIAPANRVNTSAVRVNDITAANRGAIATSGSMRLRLVYEALSKYAKDYYGKKFAVSVPGIVRKTDTDTGVISYSHDVSDGGWVDETDVTNDLFNLPSYASDLFQTQDGRFQAFAITDAYNADTSRINPTNTLFDNNYIFSKAKLHNQVYFDNGGDSYVVAEVDPIYDYPDAVVGLSGVVGAMFIATGIYFTSTSGSVTPDGINVLRRLQNNQQQGSLTYVIHPAARIPSGFEIPMKWNTLSYGPWYAQGASGNVRYEQDSSLVPWNYGGFTNLNLAGNAKASLGISPVNVIESGYVDVVGAPAYNIGDVIEANGPNITSIALSVGPEGVVTSYRFETYVPKFGQLAKYNIDTMKRLAVTNTRATAEIKARTRLNALNANSEAEASRTLSLIPLMHEAVNIRSPHNMLVSTVIGSGNESYSAVSTATYKESVGFVPDDQTSYNNTTIVPLDSVFNPYAINHSNTELPLFSVPQSGWENSKLNSTNLNPFKSSPSGWTTRIYTKGTGVYEEINDDFRIGEDLTNTPKRVIGLKGPLVMAGWGYDLQGNEVPGTETQLRSSAGWKVGPIDHLWDDYRKVWTSHDILKGVTDQAISAGGSGTVSLYNRNTDTGVNFVVYNWSDSASVPSGSKINFGYVAHDNRWNVLGVSGSGSSSSDITINAEVGSATGSNFTFGHGTTGTDVNTSAAGSTFNVNIPDASGTVARGLLNTGFQVLGGSKTFLSKTRHEDSLILMPNINGYLHNSSIAPLSNLSTTVSGSGLYTVLDVKNTSSLKTQVQFISPDNYLENGGILLLATSDGFSSSTNPYYGIWNGTINVKGKYGTDSIGNEFAGGICVNVGSGVSGSGTFSGSGSLANSNFPTMPPYSYKANITGSYATPTDAVVADFPVTTTLASGFKFLGFKADGSQSVVDYSTLPAGSGSGGGVTFDGASPSTNQIARYFDGTGDVIKYSPNTNLSDSGEIQCPGFDAYPIIGGYLRAKQLRLWDTDNDDLLQIQSGEALSISRTLTINVNDADATLNINGTVTLGQATQTLTDGTNISWSTSNSSVAKVTLTGSHTLDNPTGIFDGGTYILRVIQDGTGGWSLSYGTAYKWPGGSAPTLSSAAGSIDILTFVSDGTNMYGVAQNGFA